MSDREKIKSERNDIIRRINNLQLAKSLIEDECEILQNKLKKFNINPPVETVSVSSIDTNSTRTYSFARRSVLHRDSSFDRVSGISAAPLKNGIENFNRSAPYKKGDIVRITNKRNGHQGKAGVVDNKSSTFIYFSNDKDNWHRAPHNLERIHITEYNP